MFRSILVLTVIAVLTSSCELRRKKYDNPITKDTKQPDKVLFDKAIDDIEHGRFEVARITLNTMINTYDQSEYLAKAKLAIADSWFREGGAHGLAQAEAEYKDFILFYPTMEEAAESQEKICQIHYKQMDKSDRDTTQALRAEEECRTLITQFPNSKFIPETQQILRNIQEALAGGEFLVGDFYHHKGSNPAAANRLDRLVDQYPLYSHADLALFEMGDSYSKMGNRFRQKAGDAFARIVRDYPLSPYAEDAKKRLNQLEMPIPQADQAAYNRMKWEKANYKKPSMLYRATDLIRRGPDVSSAAKSGAPAMTSLRPTIPASIPQPVAATTGTTDVGASIVTDSKDLDTKPDARMNPPATPAGATADPAAPGAAATPAAAGATTTAAKPAETKLGDPKAQPYEPLPSNYTPRKQKKKKSSKKTQTQQPVATPPATDATTKTPDATTKTPDATTPPKQ
jgi:outer membrane protein assembly factor BamD